MTEEDFAAIEQYLGHSLPLKYVESLSSYPLNRNDLNSKIALYDNRQMILSWNAELREGEFELEWGVDRFAIGNSPCGDTYFLELDSDCDTVFVWDHETHEVTVEAPSLDSFIAKLKELEVEVAGQYAPKKARRSWWQFWS